MNEGTFYYSQFQVKHQHEPTTPTWAETSTVDITITATVEPSALESLNKNFLYKMFKKFELSNITIYPLVQNVTAGETLVQRYYYDGECTDKDYCNEITIKGLDFLSFRYFSRMDLKNSGEKDF